ncbi:DUF6121 family protein [Amnibacterium flavum]|uniref:Uncharacterized protein n=1 Tax=Amnibacterium flavum TaxID=2173173 RepID=A0A2V1HS32_9MICO|nr:DUF6121 family protein [Amnibacterium flavum]PVZ95141.1 hypothetical protein DDQ50_01000 [Amnibacterium flavum]
MSAPGPAAPAPDPRLVAAFTVVAWIATVVAAFGILSLALDLDVVPQAEAGPLLGPVMVVAAAVVLFLLLVRVIGTRQPPGVSFVGLAAGVYITFLIVGAVTFVAVTANPAQLLFFPINFGLSPFVIAAAVLAGVSGPIALAVSSRAEKDGRPRWPWEDRDQP